MLQTPTQGPVALSMGPGLISPSLFYCLCLEDEIIRFSFWGQRKPLFFVALNVFRPVKILMGGLSSGLPSFPLVSDLEPPPASSHFRMWQRVPGTWAHRFTCFLPFVPCDTFALSSTHLDSFRISYIEQWLDFSGSVCLVVEVISEYLPIQQVFLDLFLS